MCLPRATLAVRVQLSSWRLPEDAIAPPRAYPAVPTAGPCNPPFATLPTKQEFEITASQNSFTCPCPPVAMKETNSAPPSALPALLPLPIIIPSPPVTLFVANVQPLIQRDPATWKSAPAAASQNQRPPPTDWCSNRVSKMSVVPAVQDKAPATAEPLLGL